MPEIIDRDDWPVHQPFAPDAPIPGVHWYAGCDPDRPRVDPATGRCESCGEAACIECGRENCPDHKTEDKLMLVGFTGSRHGMKQPQAATVSSLLRILYEPGSWFHHGCCAGSDVEAAARARGIGYLLHGHPAVGPWRSHAVENDAEEEPDAPLARNDDIVAVCGILIATPSGRTEVIHSGTWSTIRRARKARRPHAVVWPDGSFNLYCGAEELVRRED